MRAILAVLTLFCVSNAVSKDDVPELEIELIQKGVYLHKSFNYADGFGLVSSNGLVVVDNGTAFIVDTPWSETDTAKLVGWIEAKNYELLGSISTHSHEDRTAGIKWLNANSIPTYASALTNEILESEGKELAVTSFEGPQILLAGGSIEAFYPGGGHTVDNIVVWLPKSKILFGGCFVRSLNSKGLGYTDEADIENWPSSVESVLQKYPTLNQVIPGHGKIGDIQLLKHTQILAETANNK